MGCHQLQVRVSLQPRALCAELALAVNTGVSPDPLTGVYLLNPIKYLPSKKDKTGGEGPCPALPAPPSPPPANSKMNSKRVTRTHWQEPKCSAILTTCIFFPIRKVSSHQKQASLHHRVCIWCTSQNFFYIKANKKHILLFLLNQNDFLFSQSESFQQRCNDSTWNPNLANSCPLMSLFQDWLSLQHHAQDQDRSILLQFLKGTNSPHKEVLAHDSSFCTKLWVGRCFCFSWEGPAVFSVQPKGQSPYLQQAPSPKNPDRKSIGVQRFAGSEVLRRQEPLKHD